MTDREHAIDYRRQLLRIVDQIERDYNLGKYTDETIRESDKNEIKIPFDIRAEKV